MDVCIFILLSVIVAPSEKNLVTFEQHLEKWLRPGQLGTVVGYQTPDKLSKHHTILTA